MLFAGSGKMGTGIMDKPGEEQKETVLDNGVTCNQELSIGFTDPKKEFGTCVASRSTDEFRTEIIWKNVATLLFLHAAALHGFYLGLTSTMWKTVFFETFVGIMASLGLTAGAHRLWSHRSYKAKFPLRVLLAFCNVIAFEKNIYDFSRDHRVHHKYSETDADPHNSNRGLFFSHIGWLMVKKHPEVIRMGKTIDMSDVLADPIIRIQRKYYWPLVVLFCFVLPTSTPMMLWGETFSNSFFLTVTRFVIILNITLSVNSIAHRFGRRPYNRHINPADNMWMVFGAVGEGFHNYHHTFPWDYASSEYGLRYNLTTAFIDFMAWLGLAYDLKTASPRLISERKQRTGELSFHQIKPTNEQLHPHIS